MSALDDPELDAALKDVVSGVLDALPAAAAERQYRSPWDDPVEAVRTTGSDDAARLPISGRPVRGAPGVRVELVRARELGAARDPVVRLESELHDLLLPMIGRLVRPTAGSPQASSGAEQPGARVAPAWTRFVEAVCRRRVLALRLWEAFREKRFDQEECATWTVRPDTEVGNIGVEKVLSELLAIRLVEAGLGPGSGEASAVDAVVGNVASDLAEIESRTVHEYEALGYLNGPLLDGDTSVRWTDGCGIRSVVEVEVIPTSDQHLLPAVERSAFQSRLPARVDGSNTLVRVRFQVSADGSLEHFRMAYLWAAHVVAGVVDVVRIVEPGDFGVSFLLLRPLKPGTPDIPRDYAWDYQPVVGGLTAPRRLAYAVPELPAVSDQALADVRALTPNHLALVLAGKDDTGIQRFRDSYERHSPGDPEMLLDVAVALEALILNDDPEHHELSFRLAVRLAKLLETDVKKRIEVFDDVHALYKIRSAIAHGDAVKDRKRLQQLLVKGPRLLQRALRAAIDGRRPGGEASKKAMRDAWKRLELG